MQIEGAFVQGLGWVALEELKWGDAAHQWIPPGCLYTCGPGSYKIPSLNDVPFKFNVSLLKVNILLVFFAYTSFCMLCESLVFYLRCEYNSWSVLCANIIIINIKEHTVTVEYCHSVPEGNIVMK